MKFIENIKQLRQVMQSGKWYAQPLENSLVLIPINTMQKSVWDKLLKQEQLSQDDITRIDVLIKEANQMTKEYTMSKHVRYFVEETHLAMVDFVECIKKLRKMKLKYEDYNKELLHKKELQKYEKYLLLVLNSQAQTKSLYILVNYK